MPRWLVDFAALVLSRSVGQAPAYHYPLDYLARFDAMERPKGTEIPGTRGLLLSVGSSWRMLEIKDILKIRMSARKG